MGSPVYLAVAEEVGACEFATVAAALPDCCCAASRGVGRAGSVLPPNDARTTEGWVSSPGNAKRGAEILRSFAEVAACGPDTSERNAGRPTRVFSDAAFKVGLAAAGDCATVSKETTTERPSREIW